MNIQQVCRTQVKSKKIILSIHLAMHIWSLELKMQFHL